ncbi:MULTISPECIES: Asp23/Gls24 family envelope stress response protein [Actinomadura]|uniref:Asp23/Gls24 family envelope stress response protein n=1 Tax=Actinomadura litoris TaxID=2678616 RepID=A0A7K1LD84_9ACTN|nr:MULTISPECIES: Asp23/Gls24 family envelope stress response protein [Actinomadura]MBT2214039.1 Asp23/Gls24 family envelope stress response protein [Actinomadura sp. NEAU-AAG7]MUN42216.1 Asp23/Gls24 family envelope stress response protein [Actinomadura litoris]
MTDPDQGRAGTGGEPRAEAGSLPFYPGPPGRPGPLPPGAPLPAPPASLIPHMPAPSSAHTPLTLHGGAPAPGAAPPVPRPAPDAQPDARPDAGDAAPVDGRITIDDEVVEKLVAMAALEVRGVAGLVAHPGQDGGRGAGGVRVRMHDDEVTLDLGIAVGYGSVIMEVARVVKANVARVAGLMLGMRVAAVNVAVEDVRMPAGAAPPAAPPSPHPPSV